MKHDAEELIRADKTTADEMAGAQSISEIIREVTDEHAMMEIMSENVYCTMQTATEFNDPVPVIVTTAMIYGFLWGYKLATMDQEVGND